VWRIVENVGEPGASLAVVRGLFGVRALRRFAVYFGVTPSFKKGNVHEHEELDA